MFLKISKRANEIRCTKGKEWQYLKIGTLYRFSLATSCRTGKSVSQKSIANLGSITINEYCPKNVGIVDTGFYGVRGKRAFVKSFNLDDPASFIKVDQDPPVRFYHTLARKLEEAAAEFHITDGQIKMITSQVLDLIPLYTESEYKAYIREEVKNKIILEGKGEYGKDLEKILGREARYEICDWVILMDGKLTAYKNSLKVKVDYAFELM